MAKKSTPHDPSKPALVPETVLKKKANLDRLALARQDRLQASGNRKNYTATGVTKVRKAEKFLVAARGRQNNKRRYERVMKKGLQSRQRKEGAEVVKRVSRATGEAVGSDEEEEEGGAASVTVKANSLSSPVVFAVRLRPADAATPANVKRTLSAFRLRAENEGVFLRFTEDVRRRLDACEHYVAYGPPSATLVAELLNRRGYAKVSGEDSADGAKQNERVPLSDNVLVEKVLGPLGVICVEDIAAELSSPTEAFGKVSNFLWPFRLASENSRFETQKLDARTGKKGEYGDVGEAISDMVRRMM